MCLSNLSEKLVAEEDIECYKFFKVREALLQSPYRDTIWPEDGLESEIILVTHPHKGEVVEQGLHAFEREWSAKVSSSFFKLYYGPSSIAIKKMLIPKGTVYYKGEFDETNCFAAEKMIFAPETP